MNRTFGLLVQAAGLALLLTAAPAVRAQTWNSTGMTPEQFKSLPPGGPAPRRDISGIWDGGAAGVGATGQEDERARARSPFTPLGRQMAQENKPGNGPRKVPVAEINDPLSTLGDPAGFPRLVTFELRAVQIAQTPAQVLMLYMFEQRYRVIWTDGRALPKNPDPRWYGYSVGRWEDDYTLVVETIGMDERTWIDNDGDPHSDALRVLERYRRVNQNTLELTVTIDDPKVYTKPWLVRNRMPMRLLPPNTDLMPMIPSASEAQLYSREIASQTKQ
ncbi:MAG: hypothetical protein HYU37_06290 [Acidobacteria bacterium]|nr:hypothetical protein [Acidobacteriota bacterium]